MSSRDKQYNKGNHKGTLIENWMEEMALRNATTVMNSPEKSNLDSNSRTGKGAGTMKRYEDTTSRVMIRTEEPNKTFQTSSRISNSFLTEYQPSSQTTGPREKLRKQQFDLIAKQIIDKNSQSIIENSFITTNEESFISPTSEYILSLPKPIPRGRNKGIPIDSELIGFTKTQIEEKDLNQMKAYDNSDDYTKGTAITYYSHNIRKGKGSNFPLSATNIRNPFNRSTVFTNDIRDPLKRHIEDNDFLGVLDAETFSIIEKLKAEIKLKGISIRELEESFTEIKTKGLEIILQNNGFTINNKEANKLFQYFGGNRKEQMDITLFIETLLI